MKRLCYAVLAVSASAGIAFASPPMIIEQHTYVRIRTYGSTEISRPIVWKEHKGPKCLKLDQLGGAAITQPDSVDLVLRGGQHMRAQIESSCPARDYFYSGFYLAPTADGQVCVGRDVFHSRIGGDCVITKFRKLVAQK